MPETYKAILRGNKIEWETDAPKFLQKKKPVAVYVTVINENDESDLPNGEKMAEALNKIAATGGVATIENASDWQREQRLERNLVGREKR